MSLELSAMRWLRWQKRCELVMFERCPRYGCGDPDVIGITRSRYMIEVEIKRSLSDFKRDFNKPHRSMWNINSSRLPKYFYYLAPEELAAKLIDKVPHWAGLLCGQTNQSDNLSVLKRAPENKSSLKLTIKECCKIVHLMSNHAISCFESSHYFRKQFELGCSCWPEPDYNI